MALGFSVADSRSLMARVHSGASKHGAPEPRLRRYIAGSGPQAPRVARFERFGQADRHRSETAGPNRLGCARGLWAGGHRGWGIGILFASRCAALGNQNGAPGLALHDAD